MGRFDKLTDFLFSLFGYAIIIFVTMSIAFGTLMLLVKAALNARNGEYGGVVSLAILVGVCLLWLYFDGEDYE